MTADPTLESIEAALAAATPDGNRWDAGASAVVAANARTWLAALVQRVKAAEAERDEAQALAQRMAGKVGDYSRTMQMQLDPLFQAMGRVNAILDPDWMPDSMKGGWEWEINAERVRAIRDVLKGGE